MSRNDGYATGHLLDCLYHQKYQKLIGINLSSQTNTNILQKINIVGKSAENDVVTKFSIADKQQKLF